MKFKSDQNFEINGKIIGNNSPTYFIADIAANHDGNLSRAKDLITLAAENGADAAKFQHFSAETLVSDLGFKELAKLESHQSNWGKSVYEIYKDASISLDWTNDLLEHCKNVGIDFFTSPYSLELVDYIDKFVPAYKIGSGDISWLEIIRHIALKGKPYIIATGASSIKDVDDAIDVGLSINKQLAILQCNTNYTGSIDNLKFVNLRVLSTFKERYPGLITGLSDHTPGHSTVLGAVALGAKIIEKHFTDDNSRSGPDHAFSMDPKSWKEMVDRTRELEASLGDGNKKVEQNEIETFQLQRRSVRLKTNVIMGQRIFNEDVEFLRPAPQDCLQIRDFEKLVGKKINTDRSAGDYLRKLDFEK